MVMSHVDIRRKTQHTEGKSWCKGPQWKHAYVWQSSVSEYGAMCEGGSKKRDQTLGVNKESYDGRAFKQLYKDITIFSDWIGSIS